MTVKIVGLTGGIGSGKTFISEIFRLMGIPIYNSDIQAKRLMAENLDVINDIKNLLGIDAYDSAGNLDRKYIAEIIFNNPEKLEKLNAIVHPSVRKDFEEYAKMQSELNPPYIINEAALFVENGSYKDFDKLICVVAPEALRIKRVMNRDQTDVEGVKERIRAQSTDEAKIAVSDFVIYNDAYDNLFEQIMKIHAELITFVKK
jgi:dephospho-CoA kinase